MEVGEADIFRQAAGAATQVPLLDRLWQCQCRLERSYARSQRELERLQNSRPYQAHRPEEPAPAPERAVRAPKEAAPAPHPAANLPAACIAAPDSQPAPNVPSPNVPRLISTATPMAEHPVPPAPWPPAAESQTDAALPCIEPHLRAAS